MRRCSPTISLAIAIAAAGGCASGATPRPHGPVLASLSASASAKRQSAPSPSDRHPDVAPTLSPAGTESPPDPSTPPGPTIVQEPYLGRELDLSEPLLPNAALAHSLSRSLTAEQHLVANLASQVRSGRWTVAIRTGCPVEYGGDVFVGGRAIVRDAAGNVRGYAESPGTGDSAGVWKLYYDQTRRLRLAVFAWHSVAGQSVEGLMLFDASAKLEGCATQPTDASAAYCDETSTSLGDEIDPAVVGAVRPDVMRRGQHRTNAQSPVAWVVSRDPVREFEKCETPYAPLR